MIVIVGLGNPGRQYENTKHNIGFITLDRFADKHDIKISKSKFRALVGEGIVEDKKVMLVKPQTFMNLSGESVSAIVDYYDIESDELFVVYDDIDIPIGSIRIRKKGSGGSHNGMKSIISRLDSDAFARFRIGIGADRGYVPLKDYVLTGFDSEHLDSIRGAVDRCVDAVDCMIVDGIEKAMQNYNG